MALINCPECDREISDKAKQCPHCGFPLEKTKTNNTTVFDERVNHNNSTNKHAGTIIGCVIAVVVIIAIIIIAKSHANQCAADGCHNTKLSGGKYCATHTCIESGCYNYVSSGELYCYTHRSKDTYSSYSQPTENASIVLKLSDIKVTSNSSYTICTGTLTNNGEETYTFVEVKGAFKDSSGTVLDTDWTYAVGAEGLAPGESTSFRMSVSKDVKITTCSVSLLDYDS